MASSPFHCDTCFDTGVIDHAGAEVACPTCDPITIKLTGLSHGLGASGVDYWTCVSHTTSTMTFRASRQAILNEVRRVAAAAESKAHAAGYKGRTRNWISSGPLSIERHVRKAMRQAAVAR